jgi:hypothetical protein
MSFFVDAISLSADLIHDPAIKTTLTNISKHFRPGVASR